MCIKLNILGRNSIIKLDYIKIKLYERMRKINEK